MDFKTIDTKIDDKLASLTTKLTSSMESKFASLEMLLSEQLNKRLSLDLLSSLDRTRLDSIPIIDESLQDTHSLAIDMKVKLDSISKQFADSCYKYDRIFMENLVIPGLIGDYCKFKNLREYLESHDKHIVSLSTFKEKQGIELESYIKRQEQLSKIVTTKLDQSEKTAIEFTNRSVNSLQSFFKDKFEDFSSRLGDMRIENSTAVINFQKHFSTLECDYEKMKAVEAILKKEVDNSHEDMKNLHKETANNFAQLENEYKTMKNKFDELAEYIKDVRFRRNISKLTGEKVTKKEMKQLSINIAYTNIRPEQKKTVKEHSFETVRSKNLTPVKNRSESARDNKVHSVEKDSLLKLIGRENDLDISGFVDERVKEDYKAENKKSFVDKFPKAAIRSNDKEEKQEDGLKEPKINPLNELKTQIMMLNTNFVKIKQDLFRIVKQHKETTDRSQNITKDLLNETIRELKQFLPLSLGGDGLNGLDSKKRRDKSVNKKIKNEFTEIEFGIPVRPTSGIYSRQETASRQANLRNEARKLTGAYIQNNHRSDSDFGMNAGKNFLKELKPLKKIN